MSYLWTASRRSPPRKGAAFSAFPLPGLVAFFFCCASAQTITPEVQRLYAQAQQAQAHDDLAVAEADYRKVLRLAPSLGPAYNNLGRVLFNEGRYSEAVDVLKRGLAIDPDMAPAQVMLGASLLHQSNAVDAIPHLQAGVAALPEDRFARISLTRALMQAGRPEDALAQVQSVLQADPKDQEAWYLSGKLHLELSQADFARVQALDAKSSLAQVMNGEIMEAMQNTPGAIAAYKQAVAADDAESANALQHLAHLYWSTSDWVNAKEQYRVLLTREPGNCIARWRGAESRMQLGDTDAQLLADLSSAIAACPTLAQARADRASLLLRSSQPAAALEDLKIAASEAPDEPSVQQLLARTYHALGDREAETAANRRFADLEQQMRRAAEERAASVIKANP